MSKYPPASLADSYSNLPRVGNFPHHIFILINMARVANVIDDLYPLIFLNRALWLWSWIIERYMLAEIFCYKNSIHCSKYHTKLFRGGSNASISHNNGLGYRREGWKLMST